VHEKNKLKSNVRIHMDRREFLSSAGMLLASQSLGALLPAQTKQENARAAGKADHTLRIEPCTLEIGPGVNVKTLAYNCQVPGPLLRLREGVPVSIDVTNASTDPDIVHWHGLAIDSLNDGAMEEGSPMIPAGQTHRYTFTQTFRHTLVSHPRVGVRQSFAWYLHWAVRFSPDRGQAIPSALRPGI